MPCHTFKTGRRVALLIVATTHLLMAHLPMHACREVPTSNREERLAAASALHALALKAEALCKAVGTEPAECFKLPGAEPPAAAPAPAGHADDDGTTDMEYDEGAEGADVDGAHYDEVDEDEEGEAAVAAAAAAGSEEAAVHAPQAYDDHAAMAAAIAAMAAARGIDDGGSIFGREDAGGGDGHADAVDGAQRAADDRSPVSAQQQQLQQQPLPAPAPAPCGGSMQPEEEAAAAASAAAAAAAAPAAHNLISYATLQSLFGLRPPSITQAFSE